MAAYHIYVRTFVIHDFREKQAIDMQPGFTDNACTGTEDIWQDKDSLKYDSVQYSTGHFVPVKG